MSDELKPCMTCGSASLTEDWGGTMVVSGELRQTGWIECDDCETTVYIRSVNDGKGTRDLISKWNTRSQSKIEEHLTKENARLTELAAQKASRCDELYEALVGMVEQFGEPDGSDFVNEADYAAVSNAKKVIFMQKNGLGEQDMLGGDVSDVK